MVSHWAVFNNSKNLKIVRIQKSCENKTAIINIFCWYPTSSKVYKVIQSNLKPGSQFNNLLIPSVLWIDSGGSITLQWGGNFFDKSIHCCN